MSSNDERAARAAYVRHLILRKAFFLAVPLHAYSESRGMDWNALALSLGCTTDELNRIACCRPPRPEHFPEDVKDIANTVHADEVRLMNLLREMEVSATWAQWVAEARASYDTDADLEMKARVRDVEAPGESADPKEGLGAGE